jgi:hypothetical protein
MLLRGCKCLCLPWLEMALGPESEGHLVLRPNSQSRVTEFGSPKSGIVPLGESLRDLGSPGVPERKVLTLRKTFAGLSDFHSSAGKPKLKLQNDRSGLSRRRFHSFSFCCLFFSCPGAGN